MALTGSGDAGDSDLRFLGSKGSTRLRVQELRVLERTVYPAYNR